MRHGVGTDVLVCVCIYWRRLVCLLDFAVHVLRKVEVLLQLERQAEQMCLAEQTSCCTVCAGEQGVTVSP